MIPLKHFPVEILQQRNDCLFLWNSTVYAWKSSAMNEKWAFIMTRFIFQSTINFHAFHPLSNPLTGFKNSFDTSTRVVIQSRTWVSGLSISNLYEMLWILWYFALTLVSVNKVMVIFMVFIIVIIFMVGSSNKREQWNRKKHFLRWILTIKSANSSWDFPHVFAFDSSMGYWEFRFRM